MAGADDSGVSLSNLDHSALSESSPLVLQCCNCNTVVGDSLSWVSADKIMRTIALSGVVLAYPLITLQFVLYSICFFH